MKAESIARRTVGAVLLAFATAACTGVIERADLGGEPVPGAPVPAPTRSDPIPASSDPIAMPRASTCDPSLRGASPPRIWRLTAAQYASAVRALPGLETVTFTNPLAGTESQHDRFSHYAAALRLPAVVTDALLQVARELSTPLFARLGAAHKCLGTPDAGCLRTALGPIAAKAFRRPVAPTELEWLVELVSSNQAALGAQGAVELALQVILTSPSFLFRTELGDVGADASGRRRLTPFEVASALSFALAGAPPDAALSAAAAQGALATTEQIRPHVLRLLGAPARNGPLAQFFAEYFDYERAPGVAKDSKLHPQHDPLGLVADTAAWLRDVVGERKDLLGSLFTASWGYVRQKTASAYNLTTAPAQAAKVELPPGQRAGVLTQPSFLVAFSQSDENDPIRRGKFIAQSILCIPLPDAPLEAVPPLPPLPNATLRERLAVHRTAGASCKACHDIMDPLGLGLEGYDHVGRYRTTEQGRPVDARGAIVGTGTTTDGPFDGAVELGVRLAASPVVEQCLVRHSLKYWFGRDELGSDGCAIAEVQAALRRSGGDLVEAIAALFTSDSFLYRSTM